MSTPPKLFDRNALHHRRRRVPASADLFLHEIAANEFHEKLMGVKRELTKIAIVCGIPHVWQKHWPNADVLTDAETLEFPTNDYDLIIHAMCLHQTNDPLGQLIQCQRMLKPDGLFVAGLFGGSTLATLRSTLATAETEVTGGLSPRVSPMAEIRDLGGLLQRAGFALPVADNFVQNVTYNNIRHLARDLRAHAETNVLTARSKSMPNRRIFDHADHQLGTPFNVAFEFIFLTGWCPHQSQQKPLRPGSAQVSLTDVLIPPTPDDKD